MRVSIDSLEINKTIWNFTDEVRISYYDGVLKKDSIMAVCKYEVDRDRGRLRIILNDRDVLEYEIGIASTGSFALLMRKRKKNGGQ